MFSDIEMGAGGVTDDCPRTDFLADLILSYNRSPFDRVAVDLVFNGDTFDLLKTSLDGAYPRHITSVVAVGKLHRVAQAHADFFEAVREFVSTGTAKRRVHFIVGNHDADLLFPDVQEAVRALCGGEEIHFPGFELDVGEVHFEHGHQGDAMFRMDPDQLFVGQGAPMLNLGWGSLGLLEVAMPLHPVLYHLDRVKPKEVLFEIMPEVKELLLGRSWRYWTRDYLKDLFKKVNPIKRITWPMVKEIAYRFASVDTAASRGSHYQDALIESTEHRLYVVGHRHQAAWWSRGDDKLLQTGCFRNEYMLRDGGKTQVPIAKTYAEVYLRADRLVRSHLVEIDGPPAPPGHVPNSVFELSTSVFELLGSAEERRVVEAARSAHEASTSDE